MTTTTSSLLSKGGVPNSLIRSALFAAKNLNVEKRSFHKSVSIFSQANYQIFYTGEELNQYDCQVLYAIFYLQRKSGLEFGNQITVRQADIIDLLDRKAGGSSYEPIYHSMRRLCESSIKISQDKSSSQRVYHGHIINSFHKDDRGHLAFTLNPDMVHLFEVDCTFLTLRCKVKLTRLVSKWLFDYASSHSIFIPLPIEHLMQLSGYANSKSEFVRQLGKSCEEIISVLGEESPFVRYAITEGALRLYKKKSSRQIDLSKAGPTQPADGENPFE